MGAGTRQPVGQLAACSHFPSTPRDAGIGAAAARVGRDTGVIENKHSTDGQIAINRQIDATFAS